MRRKLRNIVLATSLLLTPFAFFRGCQAISEYAADEIRDLAKNIPVIEFPIRFADPEPEAAGDDSDDWIPQPCYIKTTRKSKKETIIPRPIYPPSYEEAFTLLNTYFGCQPSPLDIEREKLRINHKLMRGTLIAERIFSDDNEEYTKQIINLDSDYRDANWKISNREIDISRSLYEFSNDPSKNEGITMAARDIFESCPSEKTLDSLMMYADFSEQRELIGPILNGEYGPDVAAKLLFNLRIDRENKDVLTELVLEHAESLTTAETKQQLLNLLATNIASLENLTVFNKTYDFLEGVAYGDFSGYRANNLRTGAFTMIIGANDIWDIANGYGSLMPKSMRDFKLDHLERLAENGVLDVCVNNNCSRALKGKMGAQLIGAISMANFAIQDGKDEDGRLAQVRDKLLDAYQRYW